MTILDGILEDNKKFVENFEGERKCLTMHKRS